MQKLSKLFFTSSQATSFVSEMLEAPARASMDAVAFFFVLLFRIEHPEPTEGGEQRQSYSEFLYRPGHPPSRDCISSHRR
jgi:hypothetical protein